MKSVAYVVANLHPIEFTNKTSQDEQHYITGEVVHFSKYSPYKIVRPPSSFNTCLIMYLLYQAMENLHQHSHTQK
jgi:hypothetical protein